MQSLIAKMVKNDTRDAWKKSDKTATRVAAQLANVPCRIKPDFPSASAAGTRKLFIKRT